MASKSSKPIENIKKICSDLGHMFEEMDKQQSAIEEQFKEKSQKEAADKDEIYEHLKQQLSELS